MAAVTTELKVLVKAVGKEQVKDLAKSLTDLGAKAAQPANRQFKQLSIELKKVQRNSQQSIANLRGYRNAWRDIAEQVDVSSREFKVATENAKKLDDQLKKIQGRKVGGGRLKAGAQIAGTVAGAGIFGGPEGAAGAGIGALLGGPSGAIVGAGIGAQVGQFRQALAGVAEYGAELTKLRIALRGVTDDQAEYSAALNIIGQATKDFAIPQSLITRQFTRLQASVSGAGGSIKDTETSFRGIVAAVRATGGSLSDVDAALTATAQVFSKGKVSAEELRQQIGERLPGAFTLFAEAIGKTPQELDKALEDGEVSLQDFLKFAEAIFKRYGETAQIIANAPESAGDRLKVSLEELNEKVAPELTRLGAQFQTFANEAAKALLGLFDLLGKIGREMERRVNGPEIKRLEEAVGNAQRALIRTDLTPEQRRIQEGFLKSAQTQLSALQFIGPPAPAGGTSDLPGAGGLPKPKSRGGKTEAEKAAEKAERARLKRLADIEREIIGEQKRIQQEVERGNKLASNFERETEFLNVRLEKGKEFEQQSRRIFTLIEGGISFTEAFGLVEARENVDKLLSAQEEAAKRQEESAQKIKALYKGIGEAITSGISGAIEGVIFQTQSLQESLSSVLRSVASLLINFGTKSLLGGFFPSAYGNVVEQNKIVPFARGGLVDKPTLFPMANGMGLMGEAGPEAIMPLRRDSSGRLGVEASGGGTSIVVNVDAQGTNVQGDEGKSRQLGSAISTAVQAELIKQQRPGGLLAR